MNNENIKLAILKVGGERHKHYEQACKDLGVEYQIIDLKESNWLENIRESKIDGIIHSPYPTSQFLKDMSDERIYFIEKHLKIPVYPNFDETYIYENKNNMAYWLSAYNIPHAKTKVFYKKSEAKDFIKSADYPIVFKTKMGAQGTGVKFIKNKFQGKRIINKTFTKLNLFAKGYTRWQKIVKFNKIKFYLPITKDKQIGHVMFQEKLPIKHEWRMIKIGESYFGHQKLIGKNQKHSGSNLVAWIRPPEELLNFVKFVCDTGNFNSMNIDVFELENGEYYVNELQTIFGSHNPSQMYIDGIPGRFIFANNKWIFEKGVFNKNASMNLRVENFVNILKRGFK